MRLTLPVLVLIALSATALAGEGKGKGKPKKVPPPPGVHWEKGLEAGLARAAREGRPIFIAVNALETERANQMLAGQQYRSKTWGQATRGYVCLVCNPNDHREGGKGPCARYPGGDCETHKATLTWFLQRFGQDLISPQHVILGPDGEVAYRKEYFTYKVGPKLLDGYLSKLAPNIAYARAGIGRAQQMKALAKAAPEKVDPLAAKWLDGDDGLAAAALLNVLDDTFAAPRRLLLIAALHHTPAQQAPVLALAAEERVLYPEDEPAETLAWLRTLFAVDRRVGVWGATRALVRLDQEAARDDVMRVWAGTAAAASAPVEALLLAKDRRARRAPPPPAWTRGRVQQIQRAMKQSGRTTVRDVGLAAELKQPRPGSLRRALLETTIDEVRKHAQALKDLLSKTAWMRVRIAAAVRLLESHMPHQGLVLQTLLDALDDPIEGPPTHDLVLRVLGEDPGQTPEAWQAAIRATLKGEAK